MQGFINKTHWIYNELIYGAYYIALTSVALVLGVNILLGLNINLLSLMISFLITLIVYSFNFQYETNTDIISNREKALFLNDRKRLFPYIIILYCLILTALLIISLNFGFIAFIIIILFGGLLYTVVFKVLTGSIPSFKSIYVTAMWAYAGTFFLYFYNGLTLDLFSICMFIYMFFKLFINVVHFDIKDVASDSVKDIKTIPILLGTKNTYVFLHVINVLSLAILLISIYANIFPFYAISLSLLFIYTFFYLYISRHADNNHIIKYSYLIGDGEPLLWPILLITGKILLGY